MHFGGGRILVYLGCVLWSREDHHVIYISKWFKWGEKWRQMEFWWYDIYGAFTLDVKSVLNENLDGILGGA